MNKMNHFVPHLYLEKRQNEQNESFCLFFSCENRQNEQNEQNDVFFVPSEWN